MQLHLSSFGRAVDYEFVKALTGEAILFGLVKPHTTMRGAVNKRICSRKRRRIPFSFPRMLRNALIPFKRTRDTHRKTSILVSNTLIVSTICSFKTHTSYSKPACHVFRDGIHDMQQELHTNSPQIFTREITLYLALRKLY